MTLLHASAACNNQLCLQSGRFGLAKGAAAFLELCSKPLYIQPAGHQWPPLPAGLAAFLELCSEPLYILATSQLKFRLRVAAEAAAAVARGGLTLWLLHAGGVHPAMALTLGQMAYAAVLLGVYGGGYMPARSMLGKKRGEAASTGNKKAAEGQRHGAQQVRLGRYLSVRLCGGLCSGQAEGCADCHVPEGLPGQMQAMLAGQWTRPDGRHQWL